MGNLFLDKTWVEEGNKRVQAFSDLTEKYSDGFFDGASDFKEIAIDKFNKEIEIFTQGNTEEARIATKVFKSVVEILKNLKYE